MELDDWTSYTETGSTNYLDNEYTREGHGALRLGEFANTEATVYEPSMATDENNASVEGRIETWIRTDEYDPEFLGVYLRFIDIENYYWVGAGRNYDENVNASFSLCLYRTQSGSTEVVDVRELDSEETFSDGSEITEEFWMPVRITWFVDEQDGFRVRIQEDANRDGEWSTIGATLVDPDPRLGPNDPDTGSGIGLGGNEVWLRDNFDRSEDDLGKVSYDDTKLYYEITE